MSNQSTWKRKVAAGIFAFAVLSPAAVLANSLDTSEATDTNSRASLDEETKTQLESLKNQVDSGELTKEEAREQLEELGIKFPGKHRGGERFDEETKQQLEEIKEQVEAGELTEEEAKAKIEELGIEFHRKHKN
ncbi:hypothetical protein Q73_02015 [Bacillus coahuilensis m2-6]|uniref:hypothetical protein n=1 Tax=Bacillus coahuilensis TaxID=408580 RepID=UPI0007504003|nr:hypothetical protein [Bacillus coahuilensis]KUP09678.1 hypothetical protein Q73_02015 [Bacillus coahuilensis m2-6]